VASVYVSWVGWVVDLGLKRKRLQTSLAAVALNPSRNQKNLLVNLQHILLSTDIEIDCSDSDEDGFLDIVILGVAG
jgi:hypothetical protein